MHQFLQLHEMYKLSHHLIPLLKLNGLLHFIQIMVFFFFWFYFF